MHIHPPSHRSPHHSLLSLNLSHKRRQIHIHPPLTQISTFRRTSTRRPPHKDTNGIVHCTHTSGIAQIASSIVQIDPTVLSIVSSSLFASKRGPSFISDLFSVIPNAHYYKRGTYDFKKNHGNQTSHKP